MLARGPTTIALTLCGAALTASGPARAQPGEEAVPSVVSSPSPSPGSGPPPAPLPAPAATTRSWYGYQILAGDLAGTALLFFGGGNDGPAGPLEIGAGITLLLADGAVIHLVHHHPVKALVSAGLRLVAPLVGTGLGLILAPAPPPGYENNGPPASLGYALLGLLVGSFAAIVTDTVVLAWDVEPVPTARPQATRASAPFVVAPALVVPPDRERGPGAMVGVIGTF
jgi:hypothetical protein